MGDHSLLAGRPVSFSGFGPDTCAARLQFTPARE
jgi:hypothetical protein